jgi:predicted membrane chloride channel (bestrophin family)
VSLVTPVLEWGLVLLLQLATVGSSGRGGLVATIAVRVIAMRCIWIDSMGRDLEDPFEGAPNGKPTTSLSITIERDLGEMLVETDFPEPAGPVRAGLM